MSEFKQISANEPLDDPTPNSQDTSSSRRNNMILIGLVSAGVIICIMLVYLVFFAGGDEGQDRVGYVKISAEDEPLRVIEFTSDNEGETMGVDMTALKDIERDELRGRTLNVNCSGENEESSGNAVIPAEQENGRISIKLDPALEIENDKHLTCGATIAGVEGSDSQRMIKAIQQFTLWPILN